ncbi:MAG: hypothetical protein GC159_22380 [Phycisphaera sp.]|nr:hypothetical protein [Phycisphaera sp.]
MYAAIVALILWPALVLLLFLTLPQRKAIIWAFLLGVMFLPQKVTIFINGLPDIDKRAMTVIAPSVFAAAALLRQPFTYRLRWFDWPMIVWCLLPFATSLSNELPILEGISAVFAQTIIWGIPYAIGRIFFNDLRGIHELAHATYCAGLIYLPLCWIELRLSPQLHMIVYGFHQHSFAEHVRWGGYRPMVFMEHAIMVGCWMAFCTIMGVAISMPKRLLRDSSGLLRAGTLLALFVTTILCKVVFVIVLLFAGMVVLTLPFLFKSRVPLAILIAAPIIYIGTSHFSYVTDLAIEWSSAVFSPERVDSLRIRLTSERLIVSRAMQRPVLGWGRFGRHLGEERVEDDNMTYFYLDTPDGKVRVIPDAFWVNTIGQWGLTGLVAMIAFMLLPGFVFVARYPVNEWTSPHLMPLFGLVIVIALEMWNFTLNFQLLIFIPLFVGASMTVRPPHQLDGSPRTIVRTQST